MMNHHMPAGPGQHHIPPALPVHPHPRRQQEYHTYHHPPQPQSPLHHQYVNYPHPVQYYSHHAGLPPQYPPQRWQHPYQAPQPYMPPPPPQQASYQPRSPMVVSSQPYGQAMTPVTRRTPIPPSFPPQQAVPSPRPIPQRMQSQPYTPVAPPSPVAMPQQKQEPDSEQEQPSTAVEATPPPQASTRRQSIPPLSLPPETRMPKYPTLPWYSQPDQPFPPRASKRRRRRQNLDSIESVALPTRDAVEDESVLPMQEGVVDAVEEQGQEEKPSDASTIRAILSKPTTEEDAKASTLEGTPSETSTIAAPSEPETPATSQAPSESDCTQVSTPATPAQATVSSPKATPTQTQHTRRDTRTAIAIPNLPGFNKPKPPSTPVEKQESSPARADGTTPTPTDQQSAKESTEVPVDDAAAPVSPPPQPKPAPKSWADLVRRNTVTSNAAVSNGVVTNNVVALPKSASLADALKQYSVQIDARLSFLEPRGLVNTGNMCYMNAILQVLVFCVPFYNFLEQVRQRTVQSMKSDTPLIDALIMFMKEFRVLATADSVDVLRSSLLQQQLEQYGDPVTPEYVYDAIRKSERFNSMRRGHQQDAEEFFGFLLEGLHDECVSVMRGQLDEKPQENGMTSPTAPMSPTSTEGWLEVGKKQKASITRTAGQQDAPSPITKIFGGHLRSELRVPGLKDSVTLEPYKPLQLDIGASHVNNIIDALKGLTRTEALTGDFGGRTNSAKKQVFIDSLPPILVLHLKRFQYENNLTGTQKIWKKVGYPLELEIPKEVFQPSKRGGLAIKGGLPKYRLTSVVYHHGKSAAGGHYTVDVLREDGREWIRMDDTIIRRIRPEDVAEGGAEEDPKILAKALEQHKNDQDLQKQRNIYQGLDEAEKEPAEEKPWSEVNGHIPGHKKWNSVANTNGTSTPASTTGKRTPTGRKEGVKDNKVAYILLYERIRA